MAWTETRLVCCAAASNGPAPENGSRKASYDYSDSGASYMPSRASVAPPMRTVSGASTGR